MHRLPFFLIFETLLFVFFEPYHINFQQNGLELFRKIQNQS